MDMTTKLVEITHAHGGGGQHQSGKRTLTADGQRVVDWARTLPDRQGAAVIVGFFRLGLMHTDSPITGPRFEAVMGGNGPPRYDIHTGQFFDYGQGNDGVVICTDPTLLVDKGTRPHRV